MNMTDSGCDVILPVALLNASAYVVCGDAWLKGILLNNAIHVYQQT